MTLNKNWLVFGAVSAIFGSIVLYHGCTAPVVAPAEEKSMSNNLITLRDEEGALVIVNTDRINHITLHGRAPKLRMVIFFGHCDWVATTDESSIRNLLLMIENTKLISAASLEDIKDALGGH